MIQGFSLKANLLGFCKFAFCDVDDRLLVYLGLIRVLCIIVRFLCWGANISKVDLKHKALDNLHLQMFCG